MLYRSPKHRARLANNRLRGTVNRASTAVCAALLGTALAQGASWDPVPGVIGASDGIINGGSGTWDLFAPNWTSDGGFTNVPWVNFDAASFAGNTGGLGSVANGGGAPRGASPWPPSAFSLFTHPTPTTSPAVRLPGRGP